MEAALELPIQSPPGARSGSGTGARTQPTLLPSPPPFQRDSALKTPLSPPRAPRDARPRKSPPALARDGDRPAGRAEKPKMRISPSAVSKSLLPVTERKSQEENKLDWRVKKDSDVEKWDIAPDGSSAGREGRQFTVANVGNNGRIYLRYA